MKNLLKIVICMLSSVLFSVQLCYAQEDSQPGEAAAGNIVDPVENSGGYSAVLYDNRNGLPTSEANDIEETEDGFIWIGSYGGLIRYDGCSFERIDSTQGITSVVSLYADSEDRLWIGTNDNGLALMGKGFFRMWKTADGLHSEKINTITGDDSGLIYIGTSYGIALIDSEMNLRTLDDPRLQGLYVDVLKTGRDGRIYGLTNNNELFVLKNGELQFWLSREDTPAEGVGAFLPDAERPGYLYFGDEQSTLYYGNPENSFSDIRQTDISPLADVRDIKKFGDQLWICARNGIGVLQNGVFSVIEGLPMSNSVQQMMADYEGNLWFCSNRQGVMKIVPNRFQDIFERWGLEETVVNSTCMYDDVLMIATDKGLLAVNADGPVESLPLTKAQTASGENVPADDLIRLLDGCRIRSIIRDSQDRMWISTWSPFGLIRYDHGEAVFFSQADGLLSGHVRAVAERRDGSFAVAVSGGVSVIEGDRITRSWTHEDGVVNTETLTVAAGENGDILAGSNGDGIYVLNEDGVRCIGRDEGLTSGIVMRIKYDPVNGVYWIVTSNSLAYMTPDYQLTTIQKFPYSNNFDLYINNQNDAWILSSNGIYVIAAEDLLANEDLQPVHYSLANGLPCTATSNSYSELTEEGDLYIAGSTGAVKINISDPIENVSDMKVSVPFVDVDGVRTYPDENGVFNLGWDVHKLVVYPYVFNYSLTDPQVTYRLSGFELNPVTVSRSELIPVTYTELPGGSYSFEMSILDAMGHSARQISVPIKKEKTIFEYTWFYIFVTSVGIAVLFSLFYLYLNKKSQEFQKQQTEAVRKERLNTELQTATRIQNSMMPNIFPPFPERKEFDIYAVMDPAREVGGDFYDFFMVDDDHLCLVIADVSGKGIPAALFMMISKVIVKNSAMLVGNPSEVLTKANEAICSNNNVEMFVTIWIGILEISTGRVTAANAGHEYPALMKKGRFELLKDRHGLVIGAMPEAGYYDYEFTLEPGDKLFVYTDGVPEATNSKEEMFGTNRMIDALNISPQDPPEKLLGTVGTAVADFAAGAEQFDDVTMMCIEYMGSSGQQDKTE
ncbi:MAG: SpoIIE family protein phosphatase [Solobacterium sp.]|nr:SpoIIE family protein phosphatase [Solobacterium sp.]